MNEAIPPLLLGVLFFKIVLMAEDAEFEVFTPVMMMMMMRMMLMMMITVCGM